MTEIVDASYTCGAHAADLAKDGVKTIFRYYSRDTGLPSKRLTRSEAIQFSNAGLKIGAVHEAKFGNRIDSFSKSLGVRDGAYARTYAHHSIGQPGSTAIYFAVDLDVSLAQIKGSIIPYFQGVAEAFAAATGEPEYVAGVYGSGATCKSILDAALARLAWLSQSSGWRGYADFKKSGRWAMLQGPQLTVGGVKGDSDSENPAVPDIGDFTPSAAAGPPIGASPLAVVNARAGLRLRTGPGTSFDIVRILPFGTAVHPLQTVEGWTMVDLQGDGAADGFVSGAYLSSA